MSGVRTDFTGALRKTAALKMTGKAMRLQATRWASETVKDLKVSAASMKKGHAMGHGKTGQLARAVGMRIAAFDRRFQVAVGTGLGTIHDVKYAKIQDEGGEVRARNAFFIIQNIKDRPRHGPFLTVPLRGVKGRASNYPGLFAVRTKTGKFLLVAPKWKKVRGGENYRRAGARTATAKRKGESGIIPFFVLKRFVRIPPSRWFTSVVDRREPILEEQMDPDVVYNIASQMSGGGGR